MEIHIQKDFKSFGGSQIQEIVKIVAAMLDCEQEEILVVDARPSGSVVLILLVKEEYAWKFTALNEEDCHNLKKLKIDYLIVDEKSILLETSTGIFLFSPATFELTRTVLLYLEKSILCFFPKIFITDRTFYVEQIQTSKKIFFKKKIVCMAISQKEEN